VSDPDSGDILLVAAGDVAALGRIAARWKDLIYSIFERTRDVASAAEATADVFDALRGSASHYQPGMRADAFLHRVLAERILRDAPATAEAISLATLAASGQARSAFVRSAVAALPSQERAAFLLTRVASIPFEAAAEALRIPAPEVQRLVVRSLSLLRAAIEPATRTAPELAPVERHFGPEAHEIPPDLNHRLAVRLAAPAPPASRWGRAALLGAVIGGIAVVLAFVLMTRTPEADRSAAGAKRIAAAGVGAEEAAKDAAGAAEDAAPPHILRVDSPPVTADTIPASSAEEAIASALFPPSFLLVVDSLGKLDPFFPEDFQRERAGPPAPHPPQLARAPEPTAEEVGERITFLRHLPPKERARISELDRAYRLRPEDARIVLWQRWMTVRGWSEETAGGLRPLAGRLDAMRDDARNALASSLRAMRELPAAERLRRFRVLPFAQALTGQERAAAEALLG
jgi:DNA-directed RNA polymerase specialized sigma24 family protein